MKRTASSVISKVMPLPASIFLIPLICNITICSISSLFKGKNIIVSSIRFRNSGRIVFFNMDITSFFVSSITTSRFSSLIFSNWLWMYALPRLEVMMIIVFLKFTVRPLLSVRRPSSKTCSRILNTSGCAFSISSNNTTEYGLRRTASVNWPPSS